MKKIVCILIMLIVQSFCYSQASFGVTGGYATNGLGVHVSYNHEINDRGYFQINLLGADSKSKTDNLEVPYRTIGVNMGYYHYIFKSRNQRFLAALGGGGSLGYEIINNGDTILDNGGIIKGNSEIVYGGFLGIESQYYISDSIAVLGVFNTYLYANSDLGLASIYSGLGIKFYIN